jgi:cell division protein FtsW
MRNRTAFTILKPSQRPDITLFFLAFGLVTFGWVMVYSTSAVVAEFTYGNQYYFLKKQVAASIIGFLCLLGTLNIPFQKWQRWAWILFTAGIVSLALVLVIGRQVGGAKRWLKLGDFGFQPSEPVKIFMILALADFLDRRQSQLKFFWKGFVPACLIFLVPAALTLREPDLGTCVLMCGTGFAIVLLGGARWEHCLGTLAAGAAGITLAILKASYRMHRVMAFLDPWKDPHGAGYQLIQSLLAIGSGGIFGKGLGNSQLKLHYLPDAHTDFIFSIIGEELGLVGTSLLLLLFAALAVRGFRIVRQAPNLFATLTATGIIFLTSFQALIHLAVSVGLMPTKGIPLPFLSFGGSSLVVMLAAFGILLNISRYAVPASPRRLRSTE